jgi:hypothetical protein
MSPEQKDAIGIRTIRSRQNLLAHLAYLKAESRYLGKRMASLSMLLQDDPTRIQFEDAKCPGIHRGRTEKDEPISLDVFRVSELDGTAVAALAQEIRDTAKEIQQLDSEIEGMKLN